MALSEVLRFRGEIIWDAPPITAAESTLRPFDFPMGSQFLWQLLVEGSGRRIPLHPAEHNWGFHAPSLGLAKL